MSGELRPAVIRVTDFAKWAKGDLIGSDAAMFAGIFDDTRKMKRPGEMFVALKGPSCDGHRFVAKAFAMGATVALVRRDRVFGIGCPVGKAIVAVDDPYQAIMDAATVYRGLLTHTRVIGVTGSAGKTTTRELLASFLRGKGKTYETPENDNIAYCVGCCVLSTPKDAEFAVYELGIGYPGDLQPILNIAKPDVGLISSIGTAHIGQFGTQEKIAREKGLLLKGLPIDSFAVLSRECSQLSVLKSMSAAPVIEVSLADETAPYFGKVTDVANGSLDVYDRDTSTAVSLTVGIPGVHTCSNALIAYACARTLGVTPAQCVEGLKSFTVPGYRWQITERQGITFINDCYNANSVSMIAVMDAVKKMSGHTVFVLGDMLEQGDLSEQLHREVGRQAAKLGIDSLITFGPMSCKWLADEFDRHSNGSKAYRAASIEEARRMMLKLAKSGDRVVLKASRGMELERVLAAESD